VRKIQEKRLKAEKRVLEVKRESEEPQTSTPAGGFKLENIEPLPRVQKRTLSTPAA
jgi:hypothetical protein